MKQTKSKTLVLMMACLLAIACNKGGETSKAFAEESKIGRASCRERL